MLLEALSAGATDYNNIFFLIYLQMSQATQFWNFEKKLIYIQKYSYITYVLDVWFLSF